KVLSGEVNPSGKLAETYPLNYSDVISSDYYPGEFITSEHRESIYIGYRYYDTARLAVRFPFGHGLSYTAFNYKNLKISGNSVSLEVENIGEYTGEEVVQLYIKAHDRKVFTPEKELKAFDKIYLKPGETKTVILALDKHAFAFYHTNQKKWIVAGGQYEILIGSSSRDIRLNDQITITGNYESFYTEVDNSKYTKLQNTSLSSEDFEALLDKPLPESKQDKKKIIDENDIIEQAKYASLFGRLLYGIIILVRKWFWFIGKPILANNVMFILEMPFRSVARMSAGRFNIKMLSGLLAMVNGHFFKGLYILIREKLRRE
ncbi:MAG TPA: glycosyl hydrolase, partial [Bacteroidales bacterium]|nr:glycosyl hydrolase [Bacteroidales bacterium]